MLQHLLRRLVFDVPILNEYAKMPLKVGGSLHILRFRNVPDSDIFGFHYILFMPNSF